jgi:hypothetical protein
MKRVRGVLVDQDDDPIPSKYAKLSGVDTYPMEYMVPITQIPTFVDNTISTNKSRFLCSRNYGYQFYCEIDDVGNLEIWVGNDQFQTIDLDNERIICDVPDHSGWFIGEPDSQDHIYLWTPSISKEWTILNQRGFRSGLYTSDPLKTPSFVVYHAETRSLFILRDCKDKGVLWVIEFNKNFKIKEYRRRYVGTTFKCIYLFNRCVYGVGMLDSALMLADPKEILTSPIKVGTIPRFWKFSHQLDTHFLWAQDEKDQWFRLIDFHLFNGWPTIRTQLNDAFIQFA